MFIRFTIGEGVMREWAVRFGRIEVVIPPTIG
jgi:hypothetical protein